MTHRALTYLYFLHVMNISMKKWPFFHSRFSPGFEMVIGIRVGI